MSQKKLFLLVIFILLFGFNMEGIKSYSHSTMKNDLLGEIKQNIFSVQTYTPSSPILITNDNDLNTSFPGKGTFDDPIRIEGYNITSTGIKLIPFLK